MFNGTATSDHQYAYFTPGDSNLVYRYEWSTLKWEQLPPSLYCDSGLVIIDGELTAVGGCDGSWCKTNKVFTLRKNQWVEHYPPMNTEYESPTAISTSDGNHVFVMEMDKWATNIEVFHMKSRKWYELVYLPPPLCLLSAAICNNQLYVIGSLGEGYSCSLQDIDQPLTSPITLTWTPLPQLPVRDSTAATLCGQLVIVGGGVDSPGTPSNSTPSLIHQLVDGQWVEIGSLSIFRYGCLVVSPSPDKMMIVSGRGRDMGILSVEVGVEECIVV